jgi:hypothetical protein
MCTVVLLVRPGHDWPLLLAANRDERVERPWDPPAAWWPDRADVVAGRDRTAGGTWMGVNAAGVVAAVLNRQGSLGPAPGKRSRGALPLMALEHATADAAVAALGREDAGEWRSFNLVIADRGGAWVLRGLGQGRPEPMRLDPGCHMVTAYDPDDPASARVGRHLPRFRAAPAPAPPDWGAWSALLADDTGPPGSEVNVPVRDGFGTVCASLLALPRDPQAAPHWLFAPGPPGRVPFGPIMPASRPAK